ncbi:MAG: hypothetical protein ACLSUW_05650 [Akkermansia sp.]
MSYDNGKTLASEEIAGRGRFCLFQPCHGVEPGIVGVLYEENQEHIKKLKFVPITIEWLTDGEDTGLAPGRNLNRKGLFGRQLFPDPFVVCDKRRLS